MKLKSMVISLTIIVLTVPLFSLAQEKGPAWGIGIGAGEMATKEGKLITVGKVSDISKNEIELTFKVKDKEKIKTFSVKKNTKIVSEDGKERVSLQDINIGDTVNITAMKGGTDALEIRQGVVKVQIKPSSGKEKYEGSLIR